MWIYREGGQGAAAAAAAVTIVCVPYCCCCCRVMMVLLENRDSGSRSVFAESIILSCPSKDGRRLESLKVAYTPELHLQLKKGILSLIA